jgi:trehalose-6-phosphate synthase
MPAQQQVTRMSALRAKLRANDLEYWSTSFLDSLTGRRALEQPAAELTAD